jgi:hypothetical protein
VPSVIPATSCEVAELGRALTEGRIPEWADCLPSWSPATLPKGYIQVLSETQTFHHTGIGEIVRDLVVPSGPGHLRIQASSNSRCNLPTSLVPRNSEAWITKMLRKFPDLQITTHMPERRDNAVIYVPGTEAGDAKVRTQLVAFLTDGWAPIWLASQVRVNSHSDWLAIQKAETQKAAKIAQKPRRSASTPLWPQIDSPYPDDPTA